MNPVKLVVKAPNQQIEDQIMEVDLNWTVLDLKKHISLNYPSKPSIKDQRLIYAGHLLIDQKSLRAEFEPLNGENIHVHLVCAQKQQTESKKAETITPSSSQEPGSTSANVAANNNHQSSNRVVTGSSIPIVNQQQLPFVNTPIMMPGMFASVPGAITPVMWTPEQMAQMQQMYTQFLTQYNLQPNAAVAPVPFFYPQMFNTNMQPNEPIVAPNVPPVVDAGEQAAGPVRLEDPDEEEEENRDWLDLFYWFSRAIVLFSVVYFYSSFSRFILVVGFAILMYLHQIGFLFPRNNRDVARRQEQPVRPRQVNRDQNEDNNDGEDTEPLNEPPVTEQTSDPERCSGLRLFWVIVSSLFTSLIPETQAPVNFN